MFLLLPVDGTLTDYEETVPLEGVEYLLSFYWSARESAYYVSIYDQDSNPLALWIRLVIGVNLLRRFVDPRLPQGLLFCSDQSGQGLDIAVQADLGTRVLLWYWTSDEPALAGINLRTTPL